MRTIITNTSPVIALSMIEKLSILWELFDKVYVPEAVFKELTSSFDENDFGRREIVEAVNDEKIILYSVKDKELVARMYAKLHFGELETIIGGKELDASFVLIDERAARNMAKNFFLTPIGTLGILRLAKSQKKIDRVKPYLDFLIANDYRIGKPLYKQILMQENEWE
ncbi:DUF3368 domain-containing protein [Virgibacillus doumboii]|uniref:DUF3368 domain-containing protein n=1 Tax=Virgibacillus doumboii TaxID=2697503 RepID=UPI0013DFF1F8|nr:DUF3368 domain-containing protein [Virgibacillus doumboii]